MSRALRDLLEETEMRVRALEEALSAPGSEVADPRAVNAQVAAAQLEVTRLKARAKALERRRRLARAELDAQRPEGAAMVALVAFCISAALSRGLWAVAEDATPDERLLLGLVVLVVSVALYASRWQRFRPLR